MAAPSLDAARREAGSKGRVSAAQVLAALFLSLAGVVLFGVAIVPLLQMTSGILSSV